MGGGNSESVCWAGGWTAYTRKCPVIQMSTSLVEVVTFSHFCVQSVKNKA